MEAKMDKKMCESIVCRVFEGVRKADAAFYRALEILGLSRKQFWSLRREARKMERGQPRFVLATPTGSGKRR